MQHTYFVYRITEMPTYGTLGSYSISTWLAHLPNLDLDLDLDLDYMKPHQSHLVLLETHNGELNAIDWWASYFRCIEFLPEIILKVRARTPM